MDLIYSNAELTIVAAAGEDETYRLPGVSLTTCLEEYVLHPDDIAVIYTGPHPACYLELESKWWTRGLTFQEGLLSRRRIIFSEHQAFFGCQKASWMEVLGKIEYMHDRCGVQWSHWRNGYFVLNHLMGQPGHNYSSGESRDLDRKRVADEAVARRMHHFFRPIQHFTTRNLTFDVEPLKAIIQ
ncbi:hypothetical protein CORC01_01561 [Colletotrichum orchidophilum]|uniref:Heterokaryon incompatibility domain-containing protein n=1 Tax=Colletotrichum orchidophilum TaxID=1209926 RepID=A0A1G4BPD5_9PEZI|nr:uncharacterized protein CORC01_01561 [Colletotrichum orchidophilum]OHF03177.1 hypothetical protein CORC01_01561 [Colletotrichum orchidophilum]